MCWCQQCMESQAGETKMQLERRWIMHSVRDGKINARETTRFSKCAEAHQFPIAHGVRDPPAFFHLAVPWKLG